jgi:PAS domain S-box-containing protein
LAIGEVRVTPERITPEDLPFRQVAQDLPTPCWISDADGLIIWVNQAWLAYTGMDVVAIQRQGLEPLHDPAVYPRIRDKWIEVKRLGQPVEITFPLRGRDGQLRPFRTRVTPIRDANGVVTRWFGTNTDVSEQSRIEAELRESQHRLELATEAAELGIWDWNLLSNTFIYSARARKICGFPAEGDVTYEDVVRVTHPDDFPRTSGMAARALDPAIRSVERYRYRILRPDGSIRIVEAHGRAVFEKSADGSERATRYVGTLQDLTDATQQAAASRETEALLNSLFEASELYIAVLEVGDDSFRYLLVNRATAAFYNQPVDTKGFDAREIGIPSEEIQQWRNTLLEVWNSGKPQTMEYAFDGGKGEGWYIGTYTPLPPGPEGQPRVSFVVIDVTERKRAEDRQRLLMREVDHRAKNVLAVAQAIVQLTQAETVPSFRHAVQGRVAALARVHTLLADERWAGADFRRLVMEELEPYITERASRVAVDGPNLSLPPAIAQSLGLVVHELATNAAKHGALSHESGDIRVTWQQSNSGNLDITWREVAPSRPSASIDRRGFGFTILQQSIERQLGGTWTVDLLEDGLSVSIHLPKTTVFRQSASLPDETGRPRVLIVEDEPLIAMALEGDLQEAGIAAGAIASSKAEALDMIRTRAFDLALLDLNLAGETTIDIARDLARAGTKVIFCTGYQDAGLPADLSGNPILVKPVDKDRLKASLAQAGFTITAG